jgi:hypothetical protein
MYNKHLMRCRLILIIFLVLFSLPQGARGQQGDPAKSSPTGSDLSAHDDDFNYIKSEIARLLQENKKLELKYAALKQRLESLKEGVAVREKETSKTMPEEWQQDRDHQRRINSIKALYSDAEKLKDDLVVKKSRNAYLSGQLLDLEEKQRLWKLRYSDLEFFKRETELDIKMLEYELKDRQQKRDRQVNDLRRQIQKSMEEEREILNRVSAIEEGTYYSPAMAAALESENDQLEIKLQAIDHELEFKNRELDILEKKRMLAAKSRGVVAGKKLEERNRLRQDVEILKQKASELNAELEESLTHKLEREEILKDFVRIQQENDKLRTQVSEIEKALGSAKK